MDENYKDVVVDSFWGAIACIIFFQIFGYLIFQSFISYLDNMLMLFYGGIWLLVFLYFQSKLMAKIRDYLSKNSIKSATLSLRQLDDWFKFILTITFSAILILFILGYYPFPQKKYNILHLVLFYIFSLIISSIFSMTIQKSIPKTKNLKYRGNLVGGFFAGGFFVLLAYLFDKFKQDSFLNFYLIGMIGFGFMTICLTIWLVNDQIK